MLSQRIALLSNRSEPELFRETIDEFKKGQKFLIRSRFVKEDYPEIYEIYKGEDGIEKAGNEYLKLVTSERPNPEEIFVLSQRILRKYDEVTLLTQHTSEKEFREKLFLEISILLSTLFILCLEILFIFRPMRRSVQSTFERINQIEDKSFVNARLALIGEIASSISHEIKNPLSVILVFSKKLMNGPSKDDEMMHSHIFKNAERINKIVKSLSMQSRESTNDQMAPAPIKNIIDDAVEMFNSKIINSNILITKSYGYSGDVNCRQAAISQVMANLMANAIDALNDIPKHNRKIHIETGVENKEVYIRLTDNGPGVPESLSEKIFESFISTKDSGKGTGIGLSISRKIMQEHGGLLSLKSEISNSCFELRFPATLNS